METINWRDRIIDKNITHQALSETNQKVEYFKNISIDYLVAKFKELAKEVHDKACEEQKQICAEEAKIYWESHVDRDSIINSPNANFNIE